MASRNDCAIASIFTTIINTRFWEESLARRTSQKSAGGQPGKVKEAGRSSAAAALISDVQVNIRLPREVRDLLSKSAGRDRSVQDVIREVIREYVTKLREQKLHEMYSAGAKDLNEEDRSDRELWIGAYSNKDQ